VQRERVTFVPFLASSETLHVKACGQQLNVFKCVLSRSASLLCLGLQGRLSRDRDRQETQNLESTYLLFAFSLRGLSIDTERHAIEEDTRRRLAEERLTR
jgi:hypothetical protein